VIIVLGGEFRMNKNARKRSKATPKSGKKKLSSRKIIVRLSNLLAKDAPKAKLSPKVEKEIILKLVQLLVIVDEGLPFGLIAWCDCSNGEYIPASACRLLGYHCE
jgi:hypothetical protein